MQLIKTLGAIASFASAAAAIDNFILTLNYTETNITSPGLNLNDFYTPFVSYANGSLFIGQVSTRTYSEPFYATFSEPLGQIGFTSYHQTPTGFTQLYILPYDNDPVGITVPHGAIVPSGADGKNFGFGPDGYLTYKGFNNFIGCENSVPNSYQVYWLGDMQDYEDPLGEKCIGPLFLFRTNVTLEEGTNIF